MKIDSKDFRVREGGKVDLKKRPTKVDPVYESKEQYQKLLDGPQFVRLVKRDKSDPDAPGWQDAL